MAHPKTIDKIIRETQPRKNTFRIGLNDNDPSLKGFSLEVLSSGSKFFVLAYTSPETGKRRFYKLGSCASYQKTSDAISDARAAREKINNGICLVEENTRQEHEKKISEQLRNNQGTVSQLFEYYIKDLETDKKPSASQVKNIFQRDIEPIIGNFIANLITKDHISDIIAAIAERGALRLANITRSYLHAAFEFGKNCKSNPRWRLNKHVPAFNINTNPVSETSKTKGGDKIGDNFIAKKDINTLWNSIGVNAMSSDCALAIKLLIATGQRVQDVLEAPYSEFDENEMLWSIPAARRKKSRPSQSQEPHIIPLTSFHIDLLHQIKLLSGNNKFLFPCQVDHTKPRTTDSLNQAVQRFCTPTGKSKRQHFKPFVPRDIRRTWKTLAGSLKISLELRNRIQGHAMKDIGSIHYDRYDYLDEKREGMQVWIDWLSNEIKLR